MTSSREGSSSSSCKLKLISSRCFEEAPEFPEAPMDLRAIASFLGIVGSILKSDIWVVPSEAGEYLSPKREPGSSFSILSSSSGSSLSGIILGSSAPKVSSRVSPKSF